MESYTKDGARRRDLSKFHMMAVASARITGGLSLVAPE
jgi:hypothetical protein